MFKHIIRLTASIVILILTINQARPQIIHQDPQDVFNELENEELTLRFFNALDGKPIPGAHIVIQSIGEYSSDAEGRVIFPIPEDGQYNIEFVKTGFISSVFKIEVLAGTIFFNRFSVSPVMPLGSIRIALDWGQKPHDLDAHLIKEGDYHISYRNKKVSEDGTARLDRDDMDGFGPETITVNDVDSEAVYYYFIHDYSDKSNQNRRELSKSKACVKIFGNGCLMEVLQIPQGKTGIYWNVFKIVNGEVVITSRLSNNSCE